MSLILFNVLTPEVLFGGIVGAALGTLIAGGSVIWQVQALTVLCECVATVPMIIFPRTNAAHARQPAWNNHLDRLRSAGVELIYGEHIWPSQNPEQRPP